MRCKDLEILSSYMQRATSVRCNGTTATLIRLQGVFGKPAYFDVTVRNPLQDSLLSQSAVTAGAAVSRGEMEKDAYHEEAVLGAGGIFIPLAVESLGLWLVWRRRPF